ncbi:MAG: permease [Caulobacteraceae bacterium]
MVVAILLAGLALLGLAYGVALVRTAAARGQLLPGPESVALGAVTNFFDTLGIGSFAPSTAWLKLRKLVPDSFLPVVLNAGHALPTVVEALIFINLVKVDPALLATCIAAAVVGAIIGAPVVVRLPVRVVQGVVGAALIIAAALFAMKNLGLMPQGGAALALPPGLFALAVVGYFVMGALMTAGIGLYAPSLIMLSLMGLDPKASFPVMMGACAFLMPVSGLGFLKSRRIDLRVVLGLALGGIPAVAVAALIVKSLPLTAIRWGVVVVVIYAAAILIRAALRPAAKATAATAVVAP